MGSFKKLSFFVLAVIMILSFAACARMGTDGYIRRDVNNAGRDVTQGVTDIGRGITRGATDVGRGVRRGVNDLGNAVEYGAADNTRDGVNGIATDRERAIDGNVYETVPVVPRANDTTSDANIGMRRNVPYSTAEGTSTVPASPF
jgi:hypothetical protein